MLAVEGRQSWPSIGIAETAILGVADGLRFHARLLPHNATIANGVASVALVHFAGGHLPIVLRSQIQLECVNVGS